MTPRAYWSRDSLTLFEWAHGGLRVVWSVTGFLEGCTISWENAVRYNGPLIPAA